MKEKVEELITEYELLLEDKNKFEFNLVSSFLKNTKKLTNDERALWESTRLMRNIERIDITKFIKDLKNLL